MVVWPERYDEMPTAGLLTKEEQEALRRSRSTTQTFLSLIASTVARFIVMKVLPEPGLADVIIST